MIRTSEQFTRAARELSLLFRMIAAHDDPPDIDFLLVADNAISDMIGFVCRERRVGEIREPAHNPKHRGLEIIEGGRSP